MNGHLLGALSACIAVAAIGLSAAYFAWGAWRWPRISAEVVRHDVYYGTDGWLIVIFIDQLGNKIEANLSDDGRDLAFLARWPIGSTIELCYNPNKPTLVARPRSPLVLILVGVVIIGFITQVFRWHILPAL